MEKIRDSSLDEAILTWLKSEWHDLPCGTPSDRRIIDNPIPGDPEENAKRKWLLRHRRIILDEIPPGAPAYRVSIEDVDLSDLYIVPTGDWYLDTGRSFRLTDTPAHLRQRRAADPRLQLGPIEHFDKVEAKAQYMKANRTTSSEVLILISSSFTGPYTIIDGTHRAAALYRAHTGKTKVSWEGILICDPLIAQSRWFINSKTAQGNIAQFSQWASMMLLQ